MKILQVIDTLNVGGAEKMCVQMANLFYEKGHDVSILFFEKTDKNLLNQINHNINVFYIPIKRNWYNPLNFFKILSLIQKFELVHIHLRSALRIVYFSSFFGKFCKCAVFHDHTGDSEQFESSSRGFLISQAIKSFKYVAVYNDLCQKTKNRFNLDSKSVDVISNFVSKPPITNIQVTPIDLNNLEILVVGNFRKPKNLYFLISLSNEFKLKKNVNFRFHVLGSINDKEYYEKFIELVYSQNLEKNFLIRTDISNIFEYNEKVNFAIMPSIEESGPLILIEYLLLKIPFLAHNVGDVTAKIGKYIPGQVLDNLNPTIWVNHVFETSYEKAICEYEKIYNLEFSNEVAYKKWIAIYKNLVSK
jgi:glycosyltransferase involved in cell wall biosynthesis